MNETKILLQTNKTFSFGEVKFIPEVPGIYMIVNLINDKKYVGQAIDLRDRLYSHIYAAQRKENYHLYNAINKYGIENFTIFILETFTEISGDIKDLLNKQEIYFVAKYKTFESGYNNTKGGEGHFGVPISEEQKFAISLQNSKKTYAYNFIDDYYLEADSRLKLAELIQSKGYKIEPVNVRDAIRNKSYSKDFIFADSKEELEEFRKTFIPPCRDKIYLYNYKEDYYSEALSIADSDKYIRSKGYSISNGHTWSAIQKNNERIKDFLFAYTKEELQEKIKNFEPYIYVYCITDEFFMQFKTNTEAVRVLNSMGYKINDSCANKAVRGLLKQSGGFLFAKSMNKLMEKIYNFNISNAEMIYKTAEEHNLLNDQNLIQWQDKINVISVK